MTGSGLKLDGSARPCDEPRSCCSPPPWRALPSLSPQPAAAATRTWTGLGLTNNWSEAAQLVRCRGVPGAADVATFDATSGKNATIGAAVNVGGIAIGAGYTGTITQNAGITVTGGRNRILSQAGAFRSPAVNIRDHRERSRSP